MIMKNVILLYLFVLLYQSQLLLLLLCVVLVVFLAFLLLLAKDLFFEEYLHDPVFLKLYFLLHLVVLQQFQISVVRLRFYSTYAWSLYLLCCLLIY